MCGITGIYSFDHRASDQYLKEMTDALEHRGPDDSGFLVRDKLALGFRRLSIIDLASGNQPIYNEDKSVVVICNGEIFNYKELKRDLVARGHQFYTTCDVEVLVHLYEEHGIDFIHKLNGQFAFCLADFQRDLVFVARDHIGIAPLFYTIAEGQFLFASEVKALFRHKSVSKKVNLQALDQIFSFPGLASPNTMFVGIHSLRPGHYITIRNNQVTEKEYWDLIYPTVGELEVLPEKYYAEKLESMMIESVKRRMNADVPIGFYLSGGLDSSLVGALMQQVQPGYGGQSFSIRFAESGFDEGTFQNEMRSRLKALHHEMFFDANRIPDLLPQAVYHAETPLKETYNVCSLMLSSMAKQNKIKVVLTGEGADELFAGYVGYRFDRQRPVSPLLMDFDQIAERDIRTRLWGDPDFFYERELYAFNDIMRSVYSAELESIHPNFASTSHRILNIDRINGRDILHKRSYIDFKLRISDHLVADHGDRVGYANSIEARYPFLDVELIDFVATIPPGLKLKDMTEKYILKQISRKYLPAEICAREKFSFVAPGSGFLLKTNPNFIQDILSFERIKKQGYFNPETVERMKRLYTSDNFQLNQTFETDLLMIILTFGILVDVFDLPNLN